MKCPKCHYLSFEPSPRCRNCGFDLGIADVDLAIRPPEEPEAPAADLELHPKRRASARRPAPKTLGLIHPVREAEASGSGGAVAVATLPPPKPPAFPSATSFQEVPLRIDMSPPAAVVGLSRPEPVRVAPPAPVPAPPPSPQPQTPGELPLFVKGLLSGPARPPLGVRRAAPELVRPKAPVPPPMPTPPRAPGPFDSDLIEDLQRMEVEENKRLRAEIRKHARTETVPQGEASKLARLAALGADWAILSAIGTMILWATLRVADARVTDLGLAALIPFSAFLLLVGLSYFLLFTAGNGQTLGKMALHIRVVDASGPDVLEPPSVRQALNRTILAAISGLLLGIGFLPALGERGIAAPDRFTRTRTVRS